MLKKIFKAVSISLLLLLLAMFGKTLFTHADEIPSEKQMWRFENANGFERFSQAIQFQVVGDDEGANQEANLVELRRFHAWMASSYPKVFSKSTVEVINGGSLLITIAGREHVNASMFLAHLDVVPVADASKWKFPPYKGVIQGDTLWGRGTLDDKNVVIALLEAMEMYLKLGLTPQRDIVLAFGHDEETGGTEGAAQIAQYLKKNRRSIGFIADEGYGVMEGIVPGLNKPAAIVGLAEKGFATLDLEVNIPGGHSAWPKPDNASAVMVEALHKIDNFQFDARLDGPIRGLFEQAAPHMNFGYKMLFSNLWLTSPLVKMVLLGKEKTAATIRTTHVTTLIHGGVKENVVPPVLKATINLRVLPGDDIQVLRKEIISVIDDDRVKVTLRPDFHAATPVSPDKGLGYDQIKQSVLVVFGDVAMVPGMVITGTDCKNYIGVTDRIYRFVPFRFNNGNLSGIHGLNEHIERKDFYRAIDFYVDLFNRL